MVATHVATESKSKLGSRPEVRLKPRPGLAALLVLSFPLVLSAQQAAQPPATAAENSELKLNPLIALSDFEASPNDPYELGRGDEISIDFAGRPELSSKRIVGPDGRVTMPLAGSVELAGKTREQAADAMVAALAPYYAGLSATVGVDKYTSNRVFLLGSVEHPGVINFDQPPTLLEVLTRGGALSGGSSGNGGGGGGGFGGNNQARSAPVLPDRCAIYRGSDKVVWVDLKGLISSGNALADLRLKRDDVVYVPSPLERYVSVLGQVQHPGALTLESGMTLSKLLAEAGGLTKEAGKGPDIRVYQAATGVTRIIPFKAVLGPAKLELTLNSGDVVFVPESGFNSATYVLERLSPLISVFTTASLLLHN
jgi:polysaccharide export outer membrane protein